MCDRFLLTVSLCIDWINTHQNFKKSQFWGNTFNDWIVKACYLIFLQNTESGFSIVLISHLTFQKNVNLYPIPFYFPNS